MHHLKGDIVKNVTEEKDVGVTFDENLIFECHVAEKVKKANSMWGMLRRTFKYMSSSIFVPLYKSMVRSHLDYASSVWSPYTMKHVEMIGVQRRATKQLTGLSEMSYQERLQYLKLPTLAYRRMRGDMIQVYKMISGRYDETVKRILRSISTTLGETLNADTTRQLKLRDENTLPIRVIIPWNSLPEEVVSVPALNTFKNRLDKQWEQQEFVYDHQAVFNPKRTNV